MQTSKEKRGKIITIEGLDGSGKSTQTKLLVERAMKAGYKVKTMSFPQYDKPTGKRIKSYLNGKFGGINSVDVKFVTKLYADDRLAAKEQVLNLLESGYDLILDRWIESNMGYQAAKFGPDTRRVFIDWIKDLEVRQNGLPESDIVVYWIYQLN